MFPDVLDVFREFDRVLRRQLPASAAGQVLATERDRLPSFQWEGIYPAVDCFTREDKLVMRAELPGVNPDDVDVSLTGNRLTIRGEKKAERKTEEKNVLIREISHGRFERSFTLTESLKPEDIKASFNNGVLELTMPVEKAETSRRIPVEASASGKTLAAV